mmetsp:Transcript_25124/g.72408  ORF Transcript_25124/g.72408 Transcript_25124/m.72408 type:complete len:297 (-) Transcript_25124:2229-3119(-)
MARSASAHAESKPKDRSINCTSLSMVFGTPTTAHSWLISSKQSKVCIAPLCVPSPPSTKYWRMFLAARDFAISGCGGLPRSLTRMLPPSLWIFCTRSSVSSIQVSGWTAPLKPPMMPYTFLTPYARNILTSSRITEFKPGQMPPHVTIAAAKPSSDGSQCNTPRGPLRKSWRYLRPPASLTPHLVNVWVLHESPVKIKPAWRLCPRGVGTFLDANLLARLMTSKRCTSSPGSSTLLMLMAWEEALRALSVDVPLGRSGTTSGERSGCFVAKRRRKNQRPLQFTRFNGSCLNASVGK